MTLKLFRFLAVATYLLVMAVKFTTAEQELIESELPLVPGLAKTHGVLMAITFVIVFPTGAILLRLLNLKGSTAVGVHAAIQLSGWVLMIAGLAEGVRVARIIASVRVSHSCSGSQTNLYLHHIAAEQHPHHPRDSRHGTGSAAAISRLSAPSLLSGNSKARNPAKSQTASYSQMVRPGTNHPRVHQRRARIAVCEQYS